MAATVFDTWHARAKDQLLQWEMQERLHALDMSEQEERLTNANLLQQADHLDEMLRAGHALDGVVGIPHAQLARHALAGGVAIPKVQCVGHEAPPRTVLAASRISSDRFHTKSQSSGDRFGSHHSPGWQIIDRSGLAGQCCVCVAFVRPLRQPCIVWVGFTTDGMRMVCVVRHVHWESLVVGFGSGGLLRSVCRRGGRAAERDCFAAWHQGCVRVGNVVCGLVWLAGSWCDCFCVGVVCIASHAVPCFNLCVRRVGRVCSLVVTRCC